MKMRLTYEIGDDDTRSVYVTLKNGKRLEVVAYDLKILTEIGEQVRFNAWGNKKQRDEIIKSIQDLRKETGET